MALAGRLIIFGGLVTMVNNVELHNQEGFLAGAVVTVIGAAILSVHWLAEDERDEKSRD